MNNKRLYPLAVTLLFPKENMNHHNHSNSDDDDGFEDDCKPIPQPVDLRLARTYVPGFLCLARGTVLIMLISRAPLNVPLVVALSVAMYVERSIRTESIFDSNAILVAVLASHCLNVMRSDPTSHAELHLSATNSAWGGIIQLFHAASGILLLAGADVSWLAWKVGATETAARGSTVLLNGVMLMGALQTPVHADKVLTPQQIIIRCYAYLSLCLLWTYAIGVRDMIDFLSTTTRVPPMQTVTSGISKGNKGNHR